ncbi:hypothetical protein [Chlamydia sp. 17-3921]|uniref:hypothetical protein n=1 Tax=Chlamydia sp. 17-3921 TaxID=2675798 RepID=UPI001F477536|nr:hypothetical protein [Chlamydia sp. 17-3921]
MNTMKKWMTAACIVGLALISTRCCFLKKSYCSSPFDYVSIVNRILDVCGLPEANSSEDLVEATESWMLSSEERISGDIAPVCQLKDEHAFYNDFSLLRMTQAVPSYAATYDCAVIFGGPLPALRQRLDFLIREWQRGVRFHKIIFLCGKRNCYPTIESREHFFDSRYNPFPSENNWENETTQKVPSSEEEIAKFIWAQMALPRAWRDSSIKVIFLLAEPSNGECASRWDTLKLFRSYQGAFSERILFVSSQPFINLDRCRLESVFNEENYDIAGPGFAQGVLKYHWASRICLHTLAQWLQESSGQLKLYRE